MLDLAITVIDRIISLVKQRQEADRELHDDFFVPLISDFEALHKSYLDTFAAYRSEIEATTVAFSDAHPVIATINRDALFTAQLRAKLCGLIDFQSDPVFSEIARAIRIYISTGEAAKTVLLEGEKPIPNAPRRRLANGLKQIFAGNAADSRKLAEAIRLVDDVVADLQSAYKQFHESAARTKRRLLDRRIK